MNLTTAIHKRWPTYPRLVARKGGHVLVVWPCGKAEHPLHVEHKLDTASYPWPEAALRLPATELLTSALGIVLIATEAEAIRLLLPHRDEIQRICDAAPTKLFTFATRPE